MAIPALGNLTWHDSCLGFGEGAFSLMAKLRSLNSVGIGYLQKELTQNREFSFLWGPDELETPLEIRLDQASLLKQLGELAFNVAGDEHFRYCPTCLKGGYHAVLNQIDIFERCPIHGELLLDRCSFCGEWTPRFAWSKRASLFPSFTCGRCRRPFVGEVSLDKRPDAWAIPTSLHGIEALHVLINAKSTSVELGRPQAWITCAPLPQVDRRAALASALLCLDQSEYINCLRKTEIKTFTPTGTEEGVAKVHDFNYRQLATEMLPPAVLDSWDWTGWRKAHRELMVPVEAGVSVELHAAYIWRHQFEDSDAIGVGRPVILGNHFEQSLELLREHSGPRWHVAMNDQFRATFARASWHAALRVAEAWKVEVETATSEERRLTLDQSWMSRLGRWDLLSASPVGFVLRKSSSRSEDLIPFIA